MQFNDERPELRGGAARPRGQGLFVKLLAVAASAVLLISAIVVSLVLFAGLIVIVVVVGGYLWWRTRHVRAEIRAAQRNSSIIEGEVIRKDTENVLTTLRAPPAHDDAEKPVDRS
jgi:hypothetical protein